MADEPNKPNPTDGGNPTDWQALYEAEKAKNAKLASDNANLDKYNKDLKGKYQAKLTDEEKFKLEREAEAEKVKEIMRENATYKARSKISGLIKDEEVANRAVDSYVNGDTDEFFKTLNAYWTDREANYEKRITEAGLHNNPTPPPAKATQGRSWKDYSMEELNALQQSNPAEYKRILATIK
nr:MAG TPA: hypothetical protein [Caudoviricetes sp.]